MSFKGASRTSVEARRDRRSRRLAAALMSGGCSGLAVHRSRARLHIYTTAQVSQAAGAPALRPKLRWPQLASDDSGPSPAALRAIVCAPDDAGHARQRGRQHQSPASSQQQPDAPGLATAPPVAPGTHQQQQRCQGSSARRRGQPVGRRCPRRRHRPAAVGVGSRPAAAAHAAVWLDAQRQLQERHEPRLCGSGQRRRRRRRPASRPQRSTHPWQRRRRSPSV